MAVFNDNDYCIFSVLQKDTKFLILDMPGFQVVNLWALLVSPDIRMMRTTGDDCRPLT